MRLSYNNDFDESYKKHLDSESKNNSDDSIDSNADTIIILAHSRDHTDVEI